MEWCIIKYKEKSTIIFVISGLFRAKFKIRMFHICLQDIKLTTG